MVKPSVFRDKTSDELVDQLSKLKKERFNLRFQRASGQLEKTHRVREVRRDIARVLTTLSQKSNGERLSVAKKSAAKKSANATTKSRVKAKE